MIEHALLWLDLETTGLLPEDPYILEMGWGVTDFDFTWLAYPGAAFPVIPKSLHITDDESWIAGDFVRNMHKISGLWEARKINELSPMDHIERMIFSTIDAHVVPGGGITLTGSGVSTFDLPMLRRWMPDLAERLTYYTIDIGNVERFFRLTTGQPLRSDSNQAKHRVIPDILEARNKAIELMTKHGGEG